MKRTIFLLLCILLTFGVCWAMPADLMSSVPASSSAYVQLRLLERHDMLSTSATIAPRGASRLLTRYDVAYLLVEPLERCVALIEAQELNTLTLEQQRRKDLAYTAIAGLSPDELQALLNATNQLLLGFHDAIEELSPGLSGRAATALRKLGLASFRPWLDTQANAAKGPTFRVSVETTPAADTFGDPLPLTTMTPPRTTRAAMPFSLNDPTTNNNTPPDASLNAVRAAIDIALGRVLVYGSLSTLTGRDPAKILDADSNSKAMVGLRVDMFRVKDLGISGIFEYHILRSPESGGASTDTGAVGGIGLAW